MVEKKEVGTAITAITATKNPPDYLFGTACLRGVFLCRHDDPQVYGGTKKG